MRVEHRCKHGKIVATFRAQCSIGQGRAGWRKGGLPGVCPWQWYMGDCPKYKHNPKHR
jgi:hypothetical protein